MLSIALLLYALCYFIPDEFDILFVLLSTVTRFAEGIGAGFSITALISYLSNNFPGHRGKVLSARSCGASFGISIGLISGSWLLKYLGYFGIFSVCSAVSLFAILALMVIKDREPAP